MVECLSRPKYHINRGPLLHIELTLLKTEPLGPNEVIVMVDCLPHLIIYLNVDCLPHIKGPPVHTSEI